MSLIGNRIEEFNAKAYHKEEFIDISHNDFIGNWSVILFYPADFSFVWPTELGNLQDQSQIFDELGVKAYSVSTDTHFTHKAWHDHSEVISKIEFPMISDSSHVLSKMFDVLDEEAGLSQRGTFIIDPDGIIQAIEITADGIGRDASQLIDKIKAAQYIRKNPSEVCPAKWKEGEETLTPGLDLVGKI